ncbi:VCBS repeat-containing protein [Sorangium sp. So ce375]|uniref:FG-GAP repeat domain-containing protein n=1 Tax=Sorangium sp. So ce375 TaxID=3133306 RepID=UPI003F5C6996
MTRSMQEAGNGLVRHHVVATPRLGAQHDLDGLALAIGRRACSACSGARPDRISRTGVCARARGASEASVRRSAATGAAPCAIAAIHTMVACTPGIDLDRDRWSAERAAPSLGRASQRASAYGWKAVRMNDFNRDDMVDVLWEHPEKSLAAIWLMEGSQLVAPGPVIPGPIGQGWEAVNAGDLNSDGMADVLWRNKEQNLVAIWLMEGSQLLSPGPIIPGPIGQNWKVISLSDLNRDGMADVIWNDKEQNVMTTWTMDGPQLLAPGPVIPGPIGEGWVARSARDFNRDGMADVIWDNEEQSLIAVWLMDGAQLLSPGPILPGLPGFHVVTAQDYNADGMADVLWNDTERNLMAVWLMEGGTLVVAPGPVIPGPLGSGWEARPAADANFDGMADVLWYATGTNQAAVWLMDGADLLAPGPVFLGPADGW